MNNSSHAFCFDFLQVVVIFAVVVVETSQQFCAKDWVAADTL